MFRIIISLVLGYVMTDLFARVLIPILRKERASQHINYYLRVKHKNKEGTPTMGGLIFILPTFLIMVIFIVAGKVDLNYTLVIILFVMMSYMAIGLIDDLLIIIKKNNKGLDASLKFGLQVVVAIVFFYLFMKSGNEPLLWIHLLHLKLDIGVFYGLFILLVLVSSSNAVNLTDGLDGLAAGLCIIAFSVFGIISLNTGWLLGYESISILCFVLVGSLIGFLKYNKYPAKIFMGDTGSLALGAMLGAYAIMSRHEVLLILVGLVFVIETISSLLQIIYYKLTGKRLFPMTPIHHTFEKMGFKEPVIVLIFWAAGLVCGLISLVYGVIL